MRSETLAAILLFFSLMPSPAPAGDAANGETLFNVSCAYCHRLIPQASGELRLKEDRQADMRRGLTNRPEGSTEPSRPDVRSRNLAARGPHLAGLFSRPPGSDQGFRYAIVPEIEGPVWTAADLDAWIALHGRIDDKDERADLIAYLKVATAR
jgi:cytochrome c2